MEENYLKKLVIDMARDYTFEYLDSTPIGEIYSKVFLYFEKAQEYLWAINEKRQDEADLNILKLGTALVFAILKTRASKESITDFSKEDWIAIAESVGDTVILRDNQYYSEYVFLLYSKYIDFNAEVMKDFASDKVYSAIKALSVDLEKKSKLLEQGKIKEVSYIEDCLWICLEAMIKLLAASVNILPKLNQENDDSNNKEPQDLVWIGDFVDSVAMLAFEYGRYKLFANEQLILTEYLQHQRELDEELSNKLRIYEEELGKNAEEFIALLDNAFSDDFRQSLIDSAKLATIVGVDSDEILGSVEDVDNFFLN